MIVYNFSDRGILVHTYKAEKDAGIDLTNQRCASVIGRVQLGENAKIFDEMSAADLMKQLAVVQTVEQLLGENQPDLALIVAIMVSTGWNSNDDIFTPAEVWKARNSPLHKPMNNQHDANQILGHIVKSRAVDKFGNEIELGDGETPPAEFDIEVAGVLYKAFPELADKINEIIAKAKIGKMFVSMEALFPDFGYGIIDPVTGSTKLVERTEATAFLTKYLRVYKGSGEYQGYKIGRVLKDIVFGAQAFTENPANPESVIKVAANQVAASRVFENAELSEISRGGVEGMEKELKELQEKLNTALASLKSKETELAEANKTLAELQEKDLETQVANLTANVEELTIKIAEASEKVEVIEGEKVELQKAIDEATERATKSEAELTEIRKNEVARDRLGKLSKVKKVEDEEVALAELRDMTDETFEAVLKYAGETKTTENNNLEGKTEAEIEAAKKKEEEEEAEQARMVLANAKVDKDVEFNANENAAESETEQYLAMAHKLCGQETEKQD